MLQVIVGHEVRGQDDTIHGAILVRFIIREASGNAMRFSGSGQRTASDQGQR